MSALREAIETPTALVGDRGRVTGRPDIIGLSKSSRPAQEHAALGS